MNSFEKIRQYENLHIVFWLVKDTCWMMELKILGAIMVIPTILLCIWIIVKTFHTLEIYINIAILFWICANSYWMLTEFFGDIHYKFYAAIPFALGFLFAIIYLAKYYKLKYLSSENDEL
jgi:Ca2+/Na+ antiporter